MKKSKIKHELSKLNFKTCILFSNNSRIWFDDLLYIRVSVGKVRSYTVLKLRAINLSNEEYDLKDEYKNTCTVVRERIYLYRGQNLKLQRIYDIITQAISIVLVSALLCLNKLFSEIWEFLLG